jgi:hypothetical protein
MTRRTLGIFRPDLTTHAEMIAAIRHRLNDTIDLAASLSDTDVCKIAIEKMYRNAYPDAPVIRAKRKMYIPLMQ